jgi:hypothetical protein
MAQTQSTRNTCEEWREDVQQLRKLAGGNTSTGVLSLRLGRGEETVRAKAQAEGISLAPASRPPYGDMS